MAGTGKGSRFGAFLKPSEEPVPESPATDRQPTDRQPTDPQPTRAPVRETGAKSGATAAPGKARGDKAAADAAKADAEAYLLRRFPRDEALARLGNGVRASSKHHLEDYVRELKRGGWPATEARVMEALFELLDIDAAFRARATVYLTGQTDTHTE